MGRYRATVSRDGRFWFVRVDGVGSTQAHNLRELDTMTKDLIAVMTGEREEKIDVDYDIKPPLRSPSTFDDPRNYEPPLPRLGLGPPPRSVVLRREDAWAYTPEHRELLARAHDDSRAGRVRKLDEDDLKKLVD